MSVSTVNIALNKSASQTNPIIGELYDASNAVDGRKTNLTFKGGQCASSKENGNRHLVGEPGQHQ